MEAIAIIRPLFLKIPESCGEALAHRIPIYDPIRDAVCVNHPSSR